MRVVITGASGYLGRSILPLLVQKADAILCLGRTPVRQSFQNVEHGVVDLLTENVDSLLEQFQPTHLIHLAWVADHGVFWNSPLNARWVCATQNLVDSFIKAGGEHVSVSGSCAEYLWNGSVCVEDETPEQPATIYGLSKLLALRNITLLCQAGNVRLAWGRVFFPYGRMENTKRLIPQIHHALKTRQRLEIFGELQRDFLFVDDAAATFVHMATHKLNGIYNVSSGTAVALSSLAGAMAEQLNRPVELIFNKSMTDNSQPFVLIGDNAKLKNTGWLPQFTIYQGLQLVNHPI